MGDELSGVEGHEKALAGALGVPDDADAAVTLRACGDRGALDRMAHGMELVIPSDDLATPEPVSANTVKSRSSGEKPGLLEHPLDDGSEFGRSLRCNLSPVNGAPRHEPFDIGSQRADTRALTPSEVTSAAFVRNRDGISSLYVWSWLKAPSRVAFSSPGFFSSMTAKRQAVDEQHDVRAAIVVILDHRELIHRQPVVALYDSSKSIKLRYISSDTPVFAGHLHRHSLDQVLVQAAVLLDERGGLGLLHLAQHLLKGLAGQVRVESF